MTGILATRIAGSSDFFGRNGRSPLNSVNFLAAHDGFTLSDVVSYAHKHNEANGENNRDGTDNNFSWNNGIEGETEDQSVQTARAADLRVMLASLFLSRGTIMLTAGDEFGRSQQGNNNAYAQDNDLTWLDWEYADSELLAFVRSLIKLRRAHPSLSGDHFLTGEAADETGLPDVTWLRADGEMMREADWNNPDRHLLGAAFYDYATAERICIWFNAGRSPQTLRLPEPRKGGSWRPALGDQDGSEVPARSVVVFNEQIKTKRNATPNDRLLHELADAAGIQPVWWTVQGERFE